MNQKRRHINLISINFTMSLADFTCFFAIGLTHLTTCATIPLDMKFNFLGIKGRRVVKSISDYKQDALVKVGREQFKKLLEKGISVPVVLL